MSLREATLQYFEFFLYWHKLKMHLLLQLFGYFAITLSFCATFFQKYCLSPCGICILLMCLQPSKFRILDPLWFSKNLKNIELLFSNHHHHIYTFSSFRATVRYHLLETNVNAFRSMSGNFKPPSTKKPNVRYLYLVCLG